MVKELLQCKRFQQAICAWRAAPDAGINKSIIILGFMEGCSHSAIFQ
jgi:hypothetical protein